MKILMASNTYLPHVGGVAKSVATFAEHYRLLGHEVLILAPEFEDAEPDANVIRTPAIQNFNGTDFSVRLPVDDSLLEPVEAFEPDIIHSHHPFLLGGTALRLARKLHVPLVFTHHTMYERYTHYVPGDSLILQQFAIQLATNYANLCDLVFAPSQSIEQILQRRGVITNCRVVPTGIDTEKFTSSKTSKLREALGIPPRAFVVGHLGRLAPEKNLFFLADAFKLFLQQSQEAHALIVGDGPTKGQLEEFFRKNSLEDRVHLVGVKKGEELIDSYQAMDAFAFASHTETQGMVLAEAMSCGLPVVALDASGVREVLADGENGRLLYEEDPSLFCDALLDITRLSETEYQHYSGHARATAENFSIELCAREALRNYSEVLSDENHPQAHDETAWENVQSAIEAELELLSASSSAMQFGLSRWLTLIMRPYNRIRRFYHKIRAWCNRAELTVRMLRLPKRAPEPNRKGLILVQIDGLSKAQFERALRKKRLPFLKRLLNREHYQLHSFYSGVPSTTPAVQAELLYGVRAAVPAFGFIRKNPLRRFRMYEPSCANIIERELEAEHAPLLTEGSSFSIIYGGGAEETHFCPSRFGWGSILEHANPVALLGFLLFNSYSLIKIAGLFLLECVLAVIDCIRGAFAGHHLLHELKFVAARVGISIALREFLVIGTKTDIARGIPKIYLNFLGYDEQAHRRGPSSNFAHWTLKGIDSAIARIYHAAKHTSLRDYDVWIFSDHGQEETISYSEVVDRSLNSVLREVFNEQGTGDETSHEGNRADWVRARSKEREAREHPRELFPNNSTFDFMAMGPVAHVYFTDSIDTEQRKRAAHKLVSQHHIPIVVYKDNSTTWVVRNAGQQTLDEAIESLIPTNHPFPKASQEDLHRLITREDSGEMLLFGWREDATPITFGLENGSHGSFGPDETHGFCLLPEASISREIRITKDAPLRADTLRQIALDMFEADESESAPVTYKSAQGRLRVITYNMHSALGNDAHFSIERVAKLLRSFSPDVIALQEVDVYRARSGYIDQAAALAEALNMHYVFHSVMEVDGGAYGNAILSSMPLRTQSLGLLPRSKRHPSSEPRGIAWAEIQWRGKAIQLFCTHVGLSREEKLIQVREILSDKWLLHPNAHGPKILCGDFNLSARSTSYKALSAHLTDTQLAAPNTRAKNTWASRTPILRLDYIFVDEHCKVLQSVVPRNSLAKIASDHLPVLADIEIRQDEHN